MKKIILMVLLMASTNSYAQITCSILDGASVYSNEAQSRYLGFFGNSSATESIMNKIGTYGSQISPSSVRSQIGMYGSTVSILSANSSLTSTPPMIIKNNQLIGYLTVNRLIQGGVSLAVIDSSCTFFSSSPTPTTISAPAQLTGLLAIPDESSITLVWWATTGATRYDIYASLSQTGDKTFLQSTTVPSFIATGAVPNTVYYFFVYPANSAGSGSGMWVSASTIPPANKPPTVNIIGGSRTVADTNLLAGETVTLTGTANDTDGTIATTQWLVNGSVVATGTSANIVLQDGATTVTFRATDNSGATTSTTAVITVTAPAPVNAPPVVAITGGNRTVSDTNGTAGETVLLTAKATDSDGAIAKTEWLVAGQVVATGTSGSLALPDGATVVTFRATDDDGASATTTATITVQNSAQTDTLWLGTFNTSAAPRGFQLDFNSIGQIVLSRQQLHSCVRIFTNGTPSMVDGMSNIEVTFKIVSLDAGIIRLIGARDYKINSGGQNSNQVALPDCSGSFESSTGEYRDVIKLGDQLFNATFKLTNEIQLEFMLTDGTEIVAK